MPLCMPSYTDSDQNAGEMGQKALELRGTLYAYHPILTLIRMRGRWGKRLQISVSRRQLLCMQSCTGSHQNEGEMGHKALDFRGTLSLCMPSHTESDQREGEMGQKASGFRGETLSLCHRILILIRMRGRWGKRL